MIGGSNPSPRSNSRQNSQQNSARRSNSANGSSVNFQIMRPRSSNGASQRSASRQSLNGERKSSFKDKPNPSTALPSSHFVTARSHITEQTGAPQSEHNTLHSVTKVSDRARSTGSVERGSFGFRSGASKHSEASVPDWVERLSTPNHRQSSARQSRSGSAASESHPRLHRCLPFHALNRTEDTNKRGCSGSRNPNTTIFEALYGLARTPRNHGASDVDPETLKRIMQKSVYSKLIPQDAYRLDLSREEDIKYLYELKHRADAEIWSGAGQGRRHGVKPKDQIAKISYYDGKDSDNINDYGKEAVRPVRRPLDKDGNSDSNFDKTAKDGMGMISRFVSGVPDPNHTPRGKRIQKDHVYSHVDLSWPANGRSAAGASENLLQWKSGRRRPPSRIPGVIDHLGYDMQPRDDRELYYSSSARPRQPGDRPGVRLIESIKRHADLQPENELPPKKESARYTKAMKEIGSGRDNDIFGVTARRELMINGARSQSADAATSRGNSIRHNYQRKSADERNSSVHSNRQRSVSCAASDPYGLEEGDVHESYCALTPTGKPSRSNVSVTSSNEPFTDADAVEPVSITIVPSVTSRNVSYGGNGNYHTPYQNSNGFSRGLVSPRDYRRGRRMDPRSDHDIFGVTERLEQLRLKKEQQISNQARMEIADPAPHGRFVSSSENIANILTWN